MPKWINRVVLPWPYWHQVSFIVRIGASTSICMMQFLVYTVLRVIGSSVAAGEVPPKAPFYCIPTWVSSISQSTDWIALFPTTGIVYPGPAAGGADKERVVICHGQVVARVAAQAAAACQFLGLVLLPGQVRDLQSGTRPADDAGPDAQAAGFHKALPLHIQGMLRKFHRRFKANT